MHSNDAHDFKATESFLDLLFVPRTKLAATTSSLLFSIFPNRLVAFNYAATPLSHSEDSKNPARQVGSSLVI